MATLPDMSQIPPEEFLRILETLMSRPPPPPRQDSVARVFELARDTFRQVLRQHQEPPQLERVNWWREHDPAEVRFEASFSRPDLSWFWAVGHSRYLFDELERSDVQRRLQQIWREMVGTHRQQLVARREQEARERLTLRAASFAPNPPIVYGADFASAAEELAVFGTAAIDVARTFTIDRRELVEAPYLTATEVRARYDDEVRAYQRRVENGLYRDMFGGPCRCDDCQRARSPARSAAEARGEKLLRQWLSPAQLAQFDGNRTFEVIGGASGKRYRIVQMPSYNVLELGGDNAVVALWCFLPAGGLVMGDIMLAQKVALETNERGALAVANRRQLQDQTGIRPGMVIGGAYGRPGRMVFLEGDWGEPMVSQPEPRPAVLREPRQPEVHPRSWMAGWGDLGRDLAAERQGLTSRAARRARR